MSTLVERREPIDFAQLIVGMWTGSVLGALVGMGLMVLVHGEPLTPGGKGMMDGREVLAMVTAPDWWERPQLGRGGREASRRFADRQIIALHAAGLTLVPRRPTPEMIDAALEVDHSIDVEAVWRAMLEVAPRS